MYKLFLFACTCFAIVSCNNENNTDRKNAYSDTPKTREDSLYKEVDEIHIEAMAKLGQLRRYMGNVEAKLDSLGKVPVAKVDKSYRQVLTTLQEDLNSANYNMDDWMEHFKHDTLKNNKDLRIQYLQSEKGKVSIVKEKMLNAIQRADSLFAGK